LSGKKKLKGLAGEDQPLIINFVVTTQQGATMSKNTNFSGQPFERFGYETALYFGFNDYKPV
jgi:hypothetical protein